jgi:hypothetical protein
MRNVKGKLNPHYIDGRSLKPNYCLDCHKRIGWHAKRCVSCANSRKMKLILQNPAIRKKYIDLLRKSKYPRGKGSRKHIIIKHHINLNHYDNSETNLLA